MKLDLQITRRQIKEADERIVQLQRVIDDLNIENDHTKDALKAAEARAQANSSNLFSQQQFTALERENRDQQKLLEFLKLKIEDFNTKATDSENVQAALRKNIEELQANVMAQRAEFARLSRVDNQSEIEAEIQKFQKQLEQTKSVSEQQLFVVNTMTEELMDIEQMTHQPWFLQLPNQFESEKDLESIREDLARNEQRAEILVRCVPTNIASRLDSSSMLPQDFAKTRASQLMEPFTNESVAQIASRVYKSLGQLRTQLDSHIRKLFAFSQSEVMKQKAQQEDAATLNELKDVVDTSVQYYQQQLKKQTEELDELKSQCRMYKNELDISRFGYDKSQTELTELRKELQQIQREASDNKARTSSSTKAQEALTEQLSEAQNLARNQQEKIAVLKQKLESIKKEHDRKMSYITDKANEDQDKNYEKYKKSLKDTVERVEMKNQKQIEKLKMKLQNYESSIKSGSVSTEISFQKEKDLSRFINTLVAYSQTLREKVDREAAVRADFAFMKRFFMMSIQTYKDGNTSQIKLLRSMGIYVDHKAIREKQDRDLAERERILASLESHNSFSDSIYNSARPYSRAGNSRGHNRRFSRIQRIEQIDDEVERNQQKDLYFRNVASGKRKIRSAAFMFIAAIRLSNLLREKKAFDESFKQLKNTLREFGVSEKKRPHSRHSSHANGRLSRSGNDRQNNTNKPSSALGNENEKYATKQHSHNKLKPSLARSHSSFGPRRDIKLY